MLELKEATVSKITETRNSPIFRKLSTDLDQFHEAIELLKIFKNDLTDSEYSVASQSILLLAEFHKKSSGDYPINALGVSEVVVRNTLHSACQSKDAPRTPISASDDSSSPEEVRAHYFEVFNAAIKYVVDSQNQKLIVNFFRKALQPQCCLEKSIEQILNWIHWESQYTTRYDSFC